MVLPLGRTNKFHHFRPIVSIVAFLERLKDQLRRHPKRIVFPEGADPRIIQAARQFVTNQLGVPILLGDRSFIKERASQLNINLERIRLVEPERTDELELYCERMAEIPFFGEMERELRREHLLDANYYAAMMVANGQADGVVSGATTLASSALRPLIRVLPRQEHVKTVSSLLILDVKVEEEDPRLLFLADSAVIPEPSAKQLADIAVTTASLRRHLTNERSKIAMLSFTTDAENSKDARVQKMREATHLARKLIGDLALGFTIEGEMQADAALDAFTARIKGLKGEVAGDANVLIFPDLMASNIASKMVQCLVGCRSYGQILTGFARPAAEISRSASAHDILGTAVIVAAQAVDRRLLFSDSRL
jgi:phosphate acetyltransferase